MERNQADADEIVLATVEECLAAHPLYRHKLIERQQERAVRLGLNPSRRLWQSRLADWLNPERRHAWPPHAFTDVIRVTGTARFLDPWLGLEQRMQREMRAARPQGHGPERRRVGA